MIGGGAGLGGVAAWVTAGNFLFRLLLERNPLACSVWNLDLTESESTIRCCCDGTDDLRMASFCLSASLYIRLYMNSITITGAQNVSVDEMKA